MTDDDVETVEIRPSSAYAPTAAPANLPPGVNFSGDVPPNAYGAPGAPDVQKNYEAALKQQEAENQLRQQEFVARQKALSGPRAQGIAMTKEGLPQPPDEPNLPNAPSGPMIDTEKFQKFGMVAFPFVMLLGKAMRADGVQALNALSSSVRGFREGSTAKASHEADQFKMKMDKVLSEYKTKVDKYHAIMQNKQMGMQQIMAQMELTAAFHDDVAVQAALRQNNIDLAFKRVDAQSKQLQIMQGQYDKIWTAVQAGKDKAARLEESRNQHAETRRHNVATEGLNQQRGVQQNTLKTHKEQAAAKEIDSTIAQIDDLVSLSSEHPEAVGGKGFITRWMEKIEGWTGKQSTDNNPATRFKTAMTLLQAHVTKSSYGGRISNFELHQMQEAIGGLEVSDSASTVQSKLSVVKSILERARGDVARDSEEEIIIDSEGHEWRAPKQK